MLLVTLAAANTVIACLAVPDVAYGIFAATLACQQWNATAPRDFEQYISGDNPVTVCSL